MEYIFEIETVAKKFCWAPVHRAPMKAARHLPAWALKVNQQRKAAFLTVL